MNFINGLDAHPFQPANSLTWGLMWRTKWPNLNYPGYPLLGRLYESSIVWAFSFHKLIQNWSLPSFFHTNINWASPWAMRWSYSTNQKHLFKVFSYLLIHAQWDMLITILKGSVICQPDAVLNQGGPTQIHISYSKYASIFHYEFPCLILFNQTPIPHPC